MSALPEFGAGGGPPAPPPPGTYTLEDSYRLMHAMERARIRTRPWWHFAKLHCRVRGHVPDARLGVCGRCGR